MVQNAREPRELVENRVSYAGPNAELSIYDTYLPATRVGLAADELLYCGMISGRKIMHGQDDYETEFLPQESFVLAPGEMVSIDFPEATMEQPTSCLTIEISSSRVSQVCSNLNKIAPLQREFSEWHYRADALFHTPHTQATQALLERLVTTFTEDSGDRDLLIDLGISELIVRMLRQQTRDFLLSTCQSQPDANGLIAAISYIRHHLAEPIEIDQLCRIACMSRSRFFSEFKKHLGCTPLEFQHQLRMKTAREKLRRGLPVTQVCYEVGYCNLSHFSRRYHRHFGESPSQSQPRLKS